MLKKVMLMAALAAWLALPAARAMAADHAAPEAAPHATETKTTELHGDAHAADAHAADAHGEHAKAPLLPDPTSGETWMSALWVVIIFVALLAILYPTAWKNVLIGLKNREKKIRDDIANAEAARKRAEETLKQYNEQLATAEAKIRDMMTKASTDAEKLATNLRMQAQQESEEIKERATREIEAARKAAVSDIYAQAAELSTNIAEKILRRNLNANDQRDLVNQSLEQLQGVGKM